MGMLHLHTHTAYDLVIEADAFTCSVLLAPDDRRQRATVRGGFAQVWQVLCSDNLEVDMEEVEVAGGLLYDAPEVLSAHARQGPMM